MRSMSKLPVIILLVVFVGTAAAFTRPHAGKFKNLQVLPQDIPEQKLDSIMESYNKALGVNCKFCHVTSVVFPGTEMDYASDKEPMKENARKMMRMTIEINKNHFYFNKEERPEYLNVVTCRTCHRGEPFPEQ
ncbi:MAG: c-type cytochrome [Chitinophagales bacterium]|nr:c-type cytochrome [Chitinophagales bacterium]